MSGLLRLVLLVFACLALTGCEFGGPTAPDPVPPVAEVPPATITDLKLTAGAPDFQTGVATVIMQAESSDPLRRPTGTVTCSSSLGQIEPNTFAFNLSTASSFTVRGATVPVDVQCAGERVSAATRVDMTAWKIQPGSVEETAYFLQNTLTTAYFTRITFRVTQRLQVPVRATALNWGDGSPEETFSGTVTGSSPMAFVHDYGRAGVFVVKAHIAWNGGDSNTALLLERTCGHDGLPWLCKTSWRVP